MANNKTSKMKQQQQPQQQQQQVNGVAAKNKPQEPQQAAQQQTQQPQEPQPTTTTTNNNSVVATTNATIASKTTNEEQSQQQQEFKQQQHQSQQQQQTNTQQQHQSQQQQQKNGNHQKSSKINGNKKHQNDGGKGTTTIIFGGLIPKAQASMQNNSATGGNGNAKVHQQSNKRGGGNNSNNNNTRAHEAKSNNNSNNNTNRNNMSAMLGITNTNYNNSNNPNRQKNSINRNYNQQQQQQHQQQTSKTYRNSMGSYAQTANAATPSSKTSKSSTSKVYTNSNATYLHQMSCPSGVGFASTVTNTSITTTTTAATASVASGKIKCDPMCPNAIQPEKMASSGATSPPATTVKRNPGDILTAALAVPCGKCAKPTKGEAVKASGDDDTQNPDSVELSDDVLAQMPTKSPLSASAYNLLEPPLSATYSAKQYRKSKSYVGSSNMCGQNVGGNNAAGKNRPQQNYYRSFSDRRSSFDRNFAERNKGFVPIVQPARPVLSSSNIAAVIADTEKLTIIERIGKGRTSYPIMQCGTLDAPDSSYHQQRSNRMDVYQIDDGFHSDGGTETPPPSPSSGSSIASTSDHGSLESVDTGGTQRLAVLSFEQVRKLHDVMDEKVAIHGRGNFPTLEVNLKDLVNAVRRKLEADIACGGAGVIVKDIRLNGGAASHVLASEDQPYNDLDLIYAIELSTTRHFDRVKTAVLNTLHDLLPEGVSKRRIIPGALKEAYVGKMVKVNNNNDGDRWSLISLGNSPGHKNVELKFVDTMRRQFEFSVDSFQIVLDSLLLFYDCAALPISENFYPTVVGESVYGDFQEALYHLQKKLISTRQPEEIRGGGLLKYCNLLVRNYKPVDPQHIKTLERYMCSRFFIDFPDINMQTVKLEAYLRNHFWGVDEEPLQYQYLMHLREVVEMSTVCLMGHERRQTLHLIQNLASQVFYKEQQKQQQQQQQTSNQSAQQQQQQQAQQQIQCHEAYQPQLVAVDLQQHSHHHHQQQHHHHHQQSAATSSAGCLSPCGQPQCQQQCQQQLVQTQPQTVTLVATTASTTSSAAGAPTTQTIYVQQAPTATICCASASGEAQAQQQQQQQVAGAASTSSAAATNAQPQTIQIQAPPGLIYANGVYYAPVIPTAICTCNATWLST